MLRIIYLAAFLIGFLIPAAWAEKIVLVAGGGSLVGSAPPLETKLNGPFGVDFDRTGGMFIIEMNGNRLRWLDRHTGVLMVLAGTGAKGAKGDGGPGVFAELNGPHALAIAPGGDVYIADTWNNKVRRIDDEQRMISTVAGTGEKGFSGDGQAATNATFGGVYCVALDYKGENLFVADLDNRRIRKVNLKTGIVTTVAGNGEKGRPRDGSLATNAPLVDPRAVAVDNSGVVYILERGGHALRFVDLNGRIMTIAGTGEKGASGDEGPGREAMLNGPKHLCVDPEGSVIIADTENHVIRKYVPRTKNILRIAGNGHKGSNGLNGPPLEAELSQPHGVAIDASGTLYIADSSNDRVLKITK